MNETISRSKYEILYRSKFIYTVDYFFFLDFLTIIAQIPNNLNAS